MDFKFFKKSIPTLIFFVVFSAIGVSVFYQLLNPTKKLKIYNPTDFNPRLVDKSLKHIQKNHKIASFTLINQNGKIITNKDYKDKIYIADFFFTRCQSICIPMAYNMGELQEYYKNDDEVLTQDLTFIANNVGEPNMGGGRLLNNGQLKKMIGEYIHVTDERYFLSFYEKMIDFLFH